MKIFLTAILLSIFIAGCDPANNPTESFAIGLISGSGGFDDAGYNNTCKTAVENFAAANNVETYFKEPENEDDYMIACAELVRSGCSLIIAPGHEAAGAVETYAKINPDINFVLIDHETKIPLANVKNIYFRVDEVCFPLGFLSAWWAHHKDNRSPRVGWIGGLNIPEIRRFTESYTAGVNYFSDKYDIDILLSQAYANSFSDPALGRQIANLMLESGTEIIFPVAGKTGIGAYEMIGTRHKWAVGVDFDMGRSDIWYSNIFLSSCVKNFEQAISTVAAASLEQNFDNEAYIGTLSNDGVKMAPYHGFETIIPDSIKQEIAQIKEKIINNEIFTGAE